MTTLEIRLITAILWALTILILFGSIPKSQGTAQTHFVNLLVTR